VADSPPTWTNLLLFDGVCNLCDHSVQFVLSHDPRGLIKFASIQSELGSRLYRERGLDPEAPTAMLLLTPAGAFSQSDAAIEIGRLLGGGYRALLLLKIIPKFLRDGVYLFIARNRYRWFGKKDQCMMPKPEWRQRFIE
jgi:predicted DCC family thiol-disulfide oxidoreductase YuxK